MTQQRYLIALSIILAISTAYFWPQTFAFPVKYVICDALHQHCFVHARFKTKDDCKVAEKRSSLYCDELIHKTSSAKRASANFRHLLL